MKALMTTKSFNRPGSKSIFYGLIDDNIFHKLDTIYANSNYGYSEWVDQWDMSVTDLDHAVQITLRDEIGNMVDWQ